MKRFPDLLVIAAALALFVALPSAASAETFGVMCKTAPGSHECVAPWQYSPGSAVTASLAPGTNVKMTSPLGETVVQCSGSSIHLNYNGTSGLEYTSSSFSGCSTSISDRSAGELILKWKEGTNNAGLNTFGELFEMGGSAYGFPSEGEGIELVGGSSPQLNFGKTPLVRLSGGYYSNLKITAQYNITPTPIYVEKPATPGVVCKSAPVAGHCEAAARYSEGTEFTATQIAGTNMLVKGPFGETFTQCTGSSIKLRYDGASELKYISSSYSGCSRPTADASNGGLFVKFKEGTSEPFGGVGQLIEMTVPIYGAATYGLAGDGIQLVQGSSPKLELVKAKMVGVSGTTAAGVVMSGQYTLSPTPIYVGES